jgi:uncharacterized protein (TIGR02246 family)
MQQDEQAIRDVIERWHERSRNGDVDGVLELMTDDVVFTVVGRPPFGKREFADGSRKLKGLKLDPHAEIVEVVVRGATAWSRVQLRVDMQLPDGRFVHRDGYALSILTKQADGKWLVARDANMLGPPT